jgi:hypothetical protein
MIKYEPNLTENDENQRELIDPPHINMDAFEDRCVIYPTPQEEYEDILLF